MSEIIKHCYLNSLFLKLCNVVKQRRLNMQKTFNSYNCKYSASSFLSIVGSFACNCISLFVHIVMIIGFTTNDIECLGKSLYYLFSSLIVCILMLSRFGQPTPINRKELQLLVLSIILFDVASSKKKKCFSLQYLFFTQNILLDISV